MSLSLRSRLSGLNPYFGWAVEYILTYAQRSGANFSITSVNRTAQEQWALFDSPNSLAVLPGCSQHQYGAAVDVVFSRQDWQRWWLASARNFGLTTVIGDLWHAQLVPGARFREWSRSQGLCPDPRYPTERPFRPFEDFQAVQFTSPISNFSGFTFQQVFHPLIHE